MDNYYYDYYQENYEEEYFPCEGCAKIVYTGYNSQEELCEWCSEEDNLIVHKQCCISLAHKLDYNEISMGLYLLFMRLQEDRV